MAPPAGAAPARAEQRIDLPTGWQPEGVTTDGSMLYVGSLATGEILRANPRNGRTTVLPRSETGKPAVGIDYDRWRKVIWVAGGPAGEIRAHSAKNGRLLGTYRLPKPNGRFINDVVVTRKAVYATDSMKQQLGVVRIKDDKVPPSRRAKKMRLTGELDYQDGFNANGIVRSGKWLILVQSNTGTLFRVNKATGRTRAINARGYSFENGDGLEPDGKRGLHVVRNQDNMVVDVKLTKNRLKARVVKEQTSSDFDVPTTVADVGRFLWAVNARFGNEDPAAADYWITRLRDPR
jgi:sugar lactone lactonase YvrE